MCIGDWTRILQAIGKMYPGYVDLAEACRHCGDAERMRRAVGQLLERGFVDARLTPRGGLSSPELHLTEAGMAVAFGVACVEEDARQAIAARERSLLRDLDRVRARRLDAFAVRAVAPSAATADPREPAPGARPYSDNSDLRRGSR
jgi:hypothetical protein